MNARVVDFGAMRAHSSAGNYDVERQAETYGGSCLAHLSSQAPPLGKSPTFGMSSNSLHVLVRIGSYCVFTHLAAAESCKCCKHVWDVAQSYVQNR